ncbi:hypothetical protein BST25_06020 [Mycobacterium heidelbergense]|uniref:Shedu protein SduA C-terminal domain-containing protein n=1 Tax=Mycobacterium heidelbergense TaxID=53376 RepID=A0A1X0DRU7_MYCHE|nr:hypothetical protein BST25_06020 [Mycobacterium heidelbergense]
MSWLLTQLMFSDVDGPATPPTQLELYDTLRTKFVEAQRFIEADEQFAEFIGEPPSLENYVARVAIEDGSPRKWAGLFVGYGSLLLEDGDPPLDAERREGIVWWLGKIWAMFLFTRNIEELVWRGYQNFGADALSDALTAWDESDKGESEEHWQTFLQERPHLIGLIFPGPVAIHQGKAYLGGKTVDNTGGKIVDFLLENSIGGDAALLEIKRPASKLLAATPYRNDIYAPTSELVGSVSQILNYRDTVVAEKSHLSLPLEVFVPSCVVLIGNYAIELDSPEKRRSFELYRSSLNGVSIVTYDELFIRLRKTLDVLRGE